MGGRAGGGAEGVWSVVFFFVSPSPAFDVVAPMVGFDGTVAVKVDSLINWLVD